MKKKSVIRKAFFMMTVHFILLLVVFFSYLFFSYHTAVGNLRDGMENLIQIYGRELENKINNADMLLERLIYANDDYTLLQSENEAIRYYASVRLKNLIEEQTAYDDYVDAVVMADSIYGVCLDYENRQISLENKTSLRDFVSRGAKKERGEAQWSIEVIGTTRYLYKMYIWQGRAVGAFISVDRFMDNVHDDELKIIGDAYLSTADLNGLSWMIASTTDVPEAAMKFLDLTYTDKDVINLLIYGIEGRDYVMNDDGTVSYPEGEDASTVPYTAQLSCGTLGNFFLMHPMEGTNPDSLEWEKEQNETAKTSPAMGFTFDSDSVKTQYTAVKNVISQYLPGLICGSLDPDTEVDKFVQALNDAGYQEILKAKQEQLDTWAEGQK